MAKRISEEQKKEILQDFVNNKTIEEISEKFNFTKLTISRNLKKNLGEKKYFEIVKTNKQIKENPKTTPAEVLTVKPAASAAPPEAPTTEAPVTLNWNPAISSSLENVISTVCVAHENAHTPR